MTRYIKESPVKAKHNTISPVSSLVLVERSYYNRHFIKHTERSIMKKMQ